MDKTILDIHENALEQDCKGHAQLAFVWGEKLANAKHAAAVSKRQMKLIEAEVTLEVRSAPEKFGIEGRATEALVEAAVKSSGDYQDAWAKLIEDEHEEAVLFALVMALKDRGEMISNMVKLHGQQYWAKPDTTMVDEEARQQTMKTAAGSVKNRKNSTMRD